MPRLTDLHDLELEQTLLACLFARPDTITEPWAAMPDDVFYLPRHRALWREMLEQHRDTGGFDLSTIASAFRRIGQLEFPLEVLTPIVAVYGGTYHPGSAYAALYARQLKEFYVTREKAQAAQRYQKALQDGSNHNHARLELEGVLISLDAMLTPTDERTDEELAHLIGPDSRFPTGIPDLDNMIGGMAKPGLNILAARPSVGKSAFARLILRNAAARRKRTYWYSQDQSESQILELEIANLLKCSTDKVRHLPTTDAVTAIRRVRAEVWHERVTLVDTPLPLENLIASIRGASPDLVVIDYLQIIDAGKDSSYENATAVSKALKAAAFALRVPILALAQFNRAYQPGTIPSLAHLRESGQIEQDADQVWALDRDTTQRGDQQLATLHVLKNKVGGAGTVQLAWHARTATFTQAARPHQGEAA